MYVKILHIRFFEYISFFLKIFDQPTSSEFYLCRLAFSHFELIFGIQLIVIHKNIKTFFQMMAKTQFWLVLLSLPALSQASKYIYNQ